MKLAIPDRFRPIVVAVAVIAVAYGSLFLVDLFDIGEPAVADCCANGFDPYAAPAPETP